MDWQTIQAFFWCTLLTITSSPAACSKDCSCEGSVTGVGCFKDSTRTNVLPELIMTDRDRRHPKFSKTFINWTNWDTYMADLVCRCATRTRELNYKIFGIENYGECWAGNDSSYDLHGSSKKCVTYEYAGCMKPSKQQCCTGAKHTLYIYKVEDVVQPQCQDDRSDCPTKANEGKCKDTDVREDCGLSCQECYYQCDIGEDKFAPPVNKAEEEGGKLVVHLSFKGGVVSGEVTDDSGNNNNGRVGSGVLVFGSTAYPCGRASSLSAGNIYFNGVTFPFKPRFAVTISMWVKLYDVTGNHVLFVTKGKRHRCPQYLLEVRGDKLLWMHRNEKIEIVFECSVRATFVNGKWYHIAAVYSSSPGKARLYLDGVELKNTAGSGELSQDWVEQVSIGDVMAGRSVNGMVDEFRMYNYTLTQTEIKSLINNC